MAPGVFESVARSIFVRFVERRGVIAPDSESGEVLLAEVAVKNADRVACEAYLRAFYRYPVDRSNRRRREHFQREGRAWSVMEGLHHGPGPTTAAARFEARAAIAQYR